MPISSRVLNGLGFFSLDGGYKMSITQEELTAAYETVVQYLKERTTSTDEERENLDDTAARAAKALNEIILPIDTIQAELDKIIARVFPSNSTAGLLPMVVHGPVPLVSMCPHHLMVVEYQCYVAYLPKPGNVLGISKLSRIAQTLAARPIMQEQLAEDIADALYKGVADDHIFPSLDSGGSATYLRGRHTCQSCRGVKSPALTSSTTIRGGFICEDGSMEQRFLTQISLIESSNR